MNKLKAALLALWIALSTVLGCALPGERVGETLAPTASAVVNGPPVATAPVAAGSEADVTPTLAPSATVGPQSNPSVEPTAIAEGEEDATTIALGAPIVIGGPGAVADGATVTITAGGTYVLSGALAEGQIIVDSPGKQDVVLVLAGVDLRCAVSAPLYIRDADEVEILLRTGTANRLEDGDTYVLAEGETDEPNAAIFSRADLAIRGEGALTVEAHYNDGIASKDDLIIRGGALTVQAVGDALRGRDAVIVSGGTLTLSAGADGIKATNDQDAAKGRVDISGGTLFIEAQQDGIAAETTVHISGGQVALHTGGGSVNSSQTAGWGAWGRPPSTQSVDTVSAKGIKGLVGVTISGGVIDIDSSDDAIHSNASVTISGGKIDIASGDDGVHADATLTVTGGELTVSESYEGLESAVIRIDDGTLRVVASDDGINVAGGVDSSAMGRPGQGVFRSTGNDYLAINGGYIAVDADGDGLDINGAVTMAGGVLIVSGPTSSGNGALDYDRGFAMTGGVLVAAGSVGMAQAPDNSSTQQVIMANLATELPADTLVHIAAADGTPIVTYAPAKPYQSLVVSSPELTRGGTYHIYTGGRSSGTPTDGVYAGGSYVDGTQVYSLTLDSIVTVAGSAGGMGPGFRPGGRR
ncbi:MAG: carbohydrate-binding domain-containing protein [Chloroflexi bacterium]|nr:carbohydrate-binding domain-containing protein [Chloroflexota bacterium]